MGQNSISLGLVADNPGVTDWAQHIEDRISNELVTSGSGAKSGTVFVEDRYPLTRQLVIEDRVALVGTQPAAFHSGSCCGFYRESLYDGGVASWSGDWLVRWKIVDEDTTPQYFSNFGAGAVNLNFSGGGDLGGVSFGSSQQASGMSNCIIRGWGGDNSTDARTGLQIWGDTYNITSVFVDPGLSANQQRDNAVGVDFSLNRVYGLSVRNLTVHSTGVGIKWGDIVACRFESLETEQVIWPLVGTYNSRMVSFYSCAFRHTDNLIDLQRTRWYDQTSVHLRGVMMDGNPCVVQIADTDGNNPVTTSEPATYDFVIEKRAPGNPPTNWTNRRIM